MIIASDLDGVICQDCPIELYDNRKEYKAWLENVKALFAPDYKIDAIVTCRLEQYRKITEKWLSDNKIKYSKLCMWNITEEERQIATTEHFARHKVEVLSVIKPDIFYESNEYEAKIISDLTKIPVLWWKEKRLI